MFIRSYHVKHRKDFSELLKKAKQVAEFAVASPKKKCSTREVDIDLPSAIKDQLLRKYGRDKDIKNVRSANLIINTNPQKRIMKDGTIKWYRNIEYENGRVYIKPLKLYFRWNPGRDFSKSIK